MNINKELTVGDSVNYHSRIGGPVTSTGHVIKSINYAPNNFGCDMAWITGKSGGVAMASLSPVEVEQPEYITRTIMYRNSFEGGDGWIYHPMSVKLSANCPKCGCQRGEPWNYRFCEDGEWFTVQRWNNECGHIDYYGDCLREHRALSKDECEVCHG